MVCVEPSCLDPEPPRASKLGEWLPRRAGFRGLPPNAMARLPGPPATTLNLEKPGWRPPVSFSRWFGGAIACDTARVYSRDSSRLDPLPSRRKLIGGPSRIFPFVRLACPSKPSRLDCLAETAPNQRRTLRKRLLAH